MLAARITFHSDADVGFPTLILRLFFAVYRELRELPTTLKFRSHVTLVSATVNGTFQSIRNFGRASHMFTSRIFLSTDAVIFEWDMQ